MSESIETLQTTTDSLKTILDQKSCQIFNKTTAIFEKVKLHSEEFKTFSKNNFQKRKNVEKADRQITEQEDNTTNPTRMANPTSTERTRKPKVNPSFQNRHNNTKLGTDHLNFWGEPGLFLVRPSFFFLLPENQDIFFRQVERQDIFFSDKVKADFFF